MKRLMWILALIAFGVLAGQAAQISAKPDNPGKVVCERVFEPVNFDKGCEPTAPARVDFAQTLPGLTTTMKTQSILQSQSNAATMRAKKYADSKMRQGTQRLRNVVMTVELPEEATEVFSGRLTKALTRSGSDLLLETEQDRQIHSPKLLEDNKTVEFEVALRAPDRRTRYLTEVAGTLEYSAAGISKQIDSGPVDFKAGTRSGLSGIGIGSIKPAESDKDNTTVGLELNLPYETIRTIKFYDQSGKELEVSAGDGKTVDGKTTAYFSVKGKLPPKGKIVLDVSEETQKKVFDFKQPNVPLKSRSRRRTDQPSGASLRDMLRQVGEPSANDPEYGQVERATLPEAADLVPEADYSTPVPNQLREAESKKEEGDLDGAIRIYRQVTVNEEASDKHVVRAYHRLGMCYLKKGDKEMAAEQFQHIVSEFPFLHKEAARASRMLNKIKPPEDKRRSLRNARNTDELSSRRNSRSSRRNSRYSPSSSRNRRSSTQR